MYFGCEVFTTRETILLVTGWTLSEGKYGVLLDLKKNYLEEDAETDEGDKSCVELVLGSNLGMYCIGMMMIIVIHLRFKQAQPKMCHSLKIEDGV